MKYEVTIDSQKYTLEAENTYEAKMQAARQHVKKYPDSFSSAAIVLARCKIDVDKVEERP